MIRGKMRIAAVFSLTVLQLWFVHGRIDAVWFWGGTVCDAAFGSGPTVCSGYPPTGVAVAVVVSMIAVRGAESIAPKQTVGGKQ
jgi:hypothetical protein